MDGRVDVRETENHDVRSGLIDLSRQDLMELRDLDDSVLDQILCRVLQSAIAGPDVSAFNSYLD